MQQLVPQQQVGFMKKRQLMSHAARWVQRVENTQWGAERWFFRSGPGKGVVVLHHPVGHNWPTGTAAHRPYTTTHRNPI